MIRYSRANRKACYCLEIIPIHSDFRGIPDGHVIIIWKVKAGSEPDFELYFSARHFLFDVEFSWILEVVSWVVLSLMFGIL